MSSWPMIFSLVVTPATAARGTRVSSRITPSTRPRTTICCSPGSKWMSVAPSSIARPRAVLTIFTAVVSCAAFHASEPGAVGVRGPGAP